MWWPTAPSVRVLEPAASLVLGTPGQRQWALRFEASDDYGVAAQATLSITTTQGSGENITFVKRSVTLHQSGEATARRFAHTLDLAALGAQPGNDVIAAAGSARQPCAHGRPGAAAA
jgi:hypothetical protein